jgi:NADPH-dependent 2,4-dienoyl-CoA reductase/sulfur reductase-like enzyme
MAEACASRHIQVTVLESGREVMASLDPEIGRLVANGMRKIGIDVRTEAAVTAITDGVVHAGKDEFPADLVILGTGVAANSALGATAGIQTGAGDGYVVDRRQATSAEGVWAAGDCCQSLHLVSGRPVYEPLGTVANKQGRVAGLNIAGGYATFPGVLGTAVTRVCGTEIGRCGLNEREARQAGFAAAATVVETTNMAAYLPDAAPVTVKLVAERGTGRLLGVQSAGGAGTAKHVDVIAASLAGRLTVDDLIGLDLSYAPPFSLVWDPLQLAARTLLPKL